MVSVFTIQLSSLLCSLLSILRKRRFERREKNEKVKSEENQKETTFFFRKSSFLFGAPGGIRTALSRFHPLPLFFTPARKSAAFCFAKLRGGSRPRGQPPRRDLTCTFPLLPSAPISHAFSEKCCILLRKIAWGFCALRTKKTGCRKSDILFFGPPGGT